MRKQILAGLATAAASDQADLKLAVETLGGKLRASHWVTNTASVEIPKDLASRLQAHPRVRKLWPSEAREPSDASAALLPLTTCGNADNHNFVAAQTMAAKDPARAKGLGVVIGFLDSGLDLDDGTGNPHQAFAGALGFRLLGSFPVLGSMTIQCGGGPVTIPAIDCNSVHPYVYSPPYPFHTATTTTHRDARHGTGVAGIALGSALQRPGSGHAPDALALGWAITRGFTMDDAGPPCGAIRWISDDATILSAIEQVIDWNAQGFPPVRILNLSWDGWASPGHPVEVALDGLAHTFDILVTTSAGNSADSTNFSHGFTNGLVVGAVTKRPWSSAPFVPAVYTVRGPLFENRKRAYPDLCAVGSGVAKPHIDNSLPTVAPADPYTTDGTSLASPQVAGAAALYLARRDAVSPPATALEAKAALLVNLMDPYGGSGPARSDPDAYRSYNTYGQGFVRDDFLCEYAERFWSGNPYSASLGPTLSSAAETVVLTPATPVVTVPWASLSTSEDYVVAIAWNRPQTLGGASAPLADVNLEVIQTVASAEVLLARSATSANSYERVVFKPMDASLVSIRLRGVDLHGVPVTVQIAARRHPEGPSDTAKHLVRGSVDEMPQPSTSTCPAVKNPDQSISIVIPQQWRDSYGSGPLALPPALPYQPFLPTPDGFHTLLKPAAFPWTMLVKGMAFRAWRPWNNTRVFPNQLTVKRVGMVQTTKTSLSASEAPSGPNGGFLGIYNADPPNGPGLGTEVVSTPMTVYLPKSDFVPQDWNAWTIYIPFATPFGYQATYTNQTQLAIWVEWGSQGGNYYPPAFDWVADGFGLCETAYKDATGLWRQDGWGPILGLSLHQDAAPALESIGEPVSWGSISPAPSYEFVVKSHSFGALPLGYSRWLILGLTDPDAPLTACLRLHSDALLGTFDMLGGGTWQYTTNQPDYRVLPYPVTPSLIFADVCAQVLELQSQPFDVRQASNGLRLRIGGKRP